MEALEQMTKFETFWIYFKGEYQIMYSGEVLWLLINAIKNYNSFFF